MKNLVLNSIMYLFGLADNPCKKPEIMTNEEAMAEDIKSLASDWRAIGGDMWKAINAYDRKIHTYTQKD